MRQEDAVLGGQQRGVVGAPRVPRFAVSRARLLVQLDASMPLAIVWGPPGAGKTVLVADWAHRRKPEGLWITVTRTTTNRREFWCAIIEIAGDADPIADTVSARPPPELGSERDIDDLLRDAACRLPAHAVLVVDASDQHLDDAVLDDLLRLLAEHPGWRVIVITRSSARMRATSERRMLRRTTIGAEELLFTDEETARALAPHGIGVAAASAFRQGTHGLALALRVIALIADEAATPPTWLGLRDEFLARFRLVLAERVDFELPLAVFAARTAPAGTLTREAAVELSGDPDAAVLLAEAADHGLGTVVDGPDGVTLAYHDLVREIFLGELLAQPPEQRKRVWARAADAADHSGAWIIALRLAVDAGDFERATRTVWGAWLRYRPTDRDTIVAILGPVPRRSLRRHPLLLMLLALCFNASEGQRARAVEYFGLVVAAARTTKGLDGEELMLVYIAESAALRLLGRVGPAALSADAALRVLAELGDELSESGNRSTVIIHAGLSHFYAGNDETARELWNSVRHHPHALALLSGLHALQGDLTTARALVAAGDDPSLGDDWADGYTAAFRRLAIAILACEDGDLVAAQSAITSLDSHIETIEHWAWIVGVQAHIDMMGEGVVVASALITSRLFSGAHVGLNVSTRRHIDITRSTLAVAAGRAAEAEQLLERHPVRAAPVAIAMARVDLLRGRSRAALRTLADAQAAATPRAQAEALLLEAVAHRRLGDHTRARHAYGDALDILAESGMRLPLALAPRTEVEDLHADAVASRDERAVSIDLARLPVLISSRTLTAMPSERERMVLGALVSSGSATEIAARLFVSPNTVKSQLRSIYRKLGVTTREQALAVAAERGMLDGEHGEGDGADHPSQAHE